MKVVLIVEDNDKNRKLARDVLQAKGYATIEAVNGEDGVRLARQRNPDLVLMDIRLPGISGIEALAELRADPETSSIPVVALTASVTSTDRTRITQAGFDAFLAKPMVLREFIDTVRHLLESGRR
ncbi:MAG: response regulator [Gammaproteobacteria bacterium]